MSYIPADYANGRDGMLLGCMTGPTASDRSDAHVLVRYYIDTYSDLSAGSALEERLIYAIIRSRSRAE